MRHSPTHFDVAVTFMRNHLRDDSMFGQHELRPASIEVSMPGGHHAIFRYVGVEVVDLGDAYELTLDAVLRGTTLNPNSGLEGQKWTLMATKKTSDPTKIIIDATFTKALTDSEKSIILNLLRFHRPPAMLHPIEIQITLEHRAEFTFSGAEHTPLAALELAVMDALSEAQANYQPNLTGERTVTHRPFP